MLFNLVSYIDERGMVGIGTAYEDDNLGFGVYVLIKNEEDENFSISKLFVVPLHEGIDPELSLFIQRTTVLFVINKLTNK